MLGLEEKLGCKNFHAKIFLRSIFCLELFIGVCFVSVGKAAVVGVGCVKVGEFWDKSLKDLAIEASLKALDEAGASKVDAIYVGSSASQIAQGQGNLAALIADGLGMFGVEALTVEASDASGALALCEAARAIRSGEANLALVVAVDKLSDISVSEASRALMASVEQEYIAYTGINIRGLAAILHNLYRQRYKVKHEDIAAFAVNSHSHAVNNPYAQYKNRITVEQVMASPVLTDPLRLLEVSSFGDGAAAAVLCPLDEAEKYSGKPVEILSVGVASGNFILTEAEDLLSFKATRLALEKACRKAGLTVKDVDLVETYDVADVIGVISLEDLGFAGRGEGALMAAKGELSVKGRVPTNTMGGLKGRGNPAGATSLYQIVEIVWQLRGEAGENQVSNAKVGLAHSLGGLYSLSTVTFLRRV
jgi:acetyl-CoA C-acetyltransferase